MNKINSNNLREKLADKQHQIWSHWQKYLHSKCFPDLDGNIVIPKTLFEKWTKQIFTDYKDLTEKEKDSDREQVNKYLPLLEEEFKRRLVEVLLKEYDKNCDDTDWKDGFKTGYNDCLKKTKQNIEIIYPSKVEKDITQN